MPAVGVAHIVQHMRRGGGAEPLVCNILRRLDKSRFSPFLVMMGRAYPEHDLEGIRILEIGLTASGKGWWTQSRFAVRLAAALRRERIQVVHSHARSADRLALALAHMAGAKVVRTMHNSPRDSSRSGLGRRIMELFTDRWTAVGPSVADYMKRCGIKPEKTETILNGIDLGRFRNGEPEARRMLRAALGLEPDAIVCLAVGRLFPQKNYPLLLRSFDAARRQADGLRLFIAGEGPDRASLETLIRELNLGGRATLLGLRDDIPDLLCAADIFVMASHYEGLTCAALEALAASKPIVATSVEGLRDTVLPDQTGYLVAPDDANAFAAAIAQLAAQPALRDQFGRRARQDAEERFSLDGMVRRYENVYKSLLGME
jgi:glycosyltransferase involved in cell wall biosynthesis